MNIDFCPHCGFRRKDSQIGYYAHKCTSIDCYGVKWSVIASFYDNAIEYISIIENNVDFNFENIRNFDFKVIEGDLNFDLGFNQLFKSTCNNVDEYLKTLEKCRQFSSFT